MFLDGPWDMINLKNSVKFKIGIATIPALRSIQLGRPDVSSALAGAVHGPEAIGAVDSHSPKPPVVKA